ncbi:MAG TPA: selenide, water dikinase SelD [Novimethylophilus sp.]|jgi:selenide,water dikinase|uniref:selenide, water dikinase SelD n=1 Tax=Novimethylophilus sp. TaxID=2137426 RepID=UPI002F3E3D8C
MNTPIKLTQFSHGGGCGCKIAPNLLQDMLAGLPALPYYPNLLVGTDTGDDAAVYRLNDSQAIVVTTDFFMPIVDDPTDFGRIAATNALSDIYAMGASPILALAVVGMPVDKLPLEAIRDILAGGAAVCAAAGIPVAGGHSIDAPEPIYGLVVVGVTHPQHIKRNNAAQAGDVLILGKPLGIGVLSAALKKGELGGDGYRQMVETATQLNSIGESLGKRADVHALTDVTGFALLGHLLEICRGSGLAAELHLADVPVLPAAQTLAQQGFATGAATRNWASYGHEVELPQHMPEWQRKLLCDPQTSGGLLAACAPAAVAEVLQSFHQAGFHDAAVIGAMRPGNPGVRVI